MQFGTNYNDTLHLLYLELLRFSVKFGKRRSGPNFEVRPAGVVILTFTLYRDFCSYDFAET